MNTHIQNSLSSNFIIAKELSIIKTTISLNIIEKNIAN